MHSNYQSNKTFILIIIFKKSKSKEIFLNQILIFLSSSYSVNDKEQSKTSHLPSQKDEYHNQTPVESHTIITRSRIENRDPAFTNKSRTSTSSKNDQKIITSISVPPKSRTPSDIPNRRSQSASSSRLPANISSPISKDQSINISPSSATESHLSQLPSKTTTNSIRTENLIETSTSNSPSISIKQKNFQRPQPNISDSTFDEYHLQPNTQTISA